MSQYGTVARRILTMVFHERSWAFCRIDKTKKASFTRVMALFFSNNHVEVHMDFVDWYMGYRDCWIV